MQTVEIRSENNSLIPRQTQEEPSFFRQEGSTNQINRQALKTIEELRISLKKLLINRDDVLKGVKWSQFEFMVN